MRNKSYKFSYKNRLQSQQTREGLPLLIVLLAGLVILLAACDFVAESNPPIEPTPNLQATVEAMVNQQLAAKEQEAFIEVAAKKQFEAIIITRTPRLTATQLPTSTPLPKPTTTATPMPTPVLTNWIDEYEYQNGTLPVYPDWILPLFPSKASQTVSKAHKREYVPSVGYWCKTLRPSQRRMLLEFFQWRGESYLDILDMAGRLAPPPGKSLSDLLYDCPPEGGLP